MASDILTTSLGKESLEVQFDNESLRVVTAIGCPAIGYTILPLQPACGQRQSRSGVFSIASHSTLQYLLPSAAVQLQGGCAHFLFCAAISPPSSRSISANTTFAEEIDLFSKSPEWCCQ